MEASEIGKTYLLVEGSQAVAKAKEPSNVSYHLGQQREQQPTGYLTR